MVHSLTPEHLAIGNGVILNGLNQAWVIVSKPTASLLGRESSAWGVIAAGSELSRLRDKSLSLNLFKTALVTHPWYFVVRRGRCLRYP
jgi:hypothetical protein